MSKWRDIETIPCPGLLEAQAQLKQARQPLTDALKRWRAQQEQIQAADPLLTPSEYRGVRSKDGQRVTVQFREVVDDGSDH